VSSLLRVVFDSDTTPPGTPSIISVAPVGQGRLDITWTSATDTGGSGLSGYNLQIDGSTLVTLGVQTSYSHTGLTPSSVHTYRVQSRDGNGNTSPLSAQSSGTAAAPPAVYNPNYPRLGSYAIGGTQLASASELARRHVNILAHYPGWQQSKGTTLAALISSVKAASTIGAKVFAYVIYSEVAKAASSDGNSYREVYDYANTNGLWAYTNGVAKTGQVESQYSPPDYWKLNYTSNGELVTGKNLGQWYVDWATRLNRDGGTFSIGSGSRVVDPAPQIDGLFFDNVFFEERVNADYDRNGTLDGTSNTTARAYIETSHAALATYYRTLWPTAPLLANSADWPEYEIQGLGSFSATPLSQVYEGGVIETVQNYEAANSFKRAIDAIKVQMDAYRAPKLGVLEVDITSATNYRFMRYWLGISLLTDPYYYPNLGSYLTQDLSSLWFDEFNFNLGASSEAVQTAPRYSGNATTGEGVWRRDFANGIVLVGARRGSGGSVASGPTGDQDTPYASVSLGGTFYRLTGTQDAATNSGAAVTSISIRPRDAVVLSRTPTGSGSSGFTAVSGYTPVGTFNNGQTFTIQKQGGGFGSGPQILVFADFRGGTPGAEVSLSQTMGSFSSITTSGSGSSTQKPFYMTGGRDGNTCMSTMTDALGAANRWAQAIISGAADFTSFYMARAVYGDFTTGSQANSNQKDVWVCRNGNTTGGGHDIYEGAFVGVFSNSGPIPPFYYAGSGPPCDLAFRNQSLPNDGYFPRNEWTFNEWGVRPTTTAGANALIDLFGTYCNDTYGWNRSTSTGLWRSWSSSGVTPAWNHVYFPGDYQDRPGSGHGVPAPYLTYYKWDDLYFAVGPNAWKRFLIGDAPTIAACKKLYICPHIVWADGSVTLSLPHTEWTSFVGKHLFWFDNSGLVATRVGVGS
jgi:hypothetical protein